MHQGDLGLRLGHQRLVTAERVEPEPLRVHAGCVDPGPRQRRVPPHHDRDVLHVVFASSGPDPADLEGVRGGVEGGPDPFQG